MSDVMSDVWSEVVDQTRLLIRSSRHLAHRHLEIYEGLGQTLGSMLGLLAKDGPMRLRALADHLQVDASVVSRQVAELADRGLVVRRPDPADARAGLLHVTDDGHAMVERARTRRMNVLSAALGDWSEADAQHLLMLLTRLNADFRRAVCAESGARPDPSRNTAEGITP